MGRLIRNGTQFGVGKMPQVSNPNLLDNPFFTVNQRQGKIAPQGVPFYYDEACTNKWGDDWIETVSVERIANGNYRHYFSNVSSYGYFKASDVVDGCFNDYCLDRWYGAYQLVNGNVKFNLQGWYCWQPLEQSLRSALIGKTITASVKMANGAIYSGTIVYNDVQNYIFTNENLLVLTGENHTFMVWANSPCEISAVKLELGTVSTLANDIAPDYGTELRKCQYYYQPCQLGRLRPFNVLADKIGFLINLPLPMRTNGIVTIDESKLSVVNMLGAKQSGFTFTSAWIKDGGVRIDANKTAHGLTDAVLSMSEGGGIWVSADL